VNSENIISVNVANGVSIVVMALIGALLVGALRKMSGKKSSGLAAGPGAASQT
jgi:hypothetical protein